MLSFVHVRLYTTMGMASMGQGLTSPYSFVTKLETKD